MMDVPPVHWAGKTALCEMCTILEYYPYQMIAMPLPLDEQTWHLQRTFPTTR